MENRVLPDVYAVVSLELFKPYTHKIPEDTILGDHFNKALRAVENLRQVQRRIENLWRIIASECYGWVRFHKYDLLHPERKIVVEMDKVDRGSTVSENIFKLVGFRTTNVGYSLYFLDINRRCSEEEKKQYRRRGDVKYFAGEDALEVLFDDDAQKVVETIRYVLFQLIKKNESELKDCLPDD